MEDSLEILDVGTKLFYNNLAPQMRNLKHLCMLKLFFKTFSIPTQFTHLVLPKKSLLTQVLTSFITSF